jgi:ABC-type bacteriocin/lantibiotic exporter with double-glycine peptidase domain
MPIKPVKVGRVRIVRVGNLKSRYSLHTANRIMGSRIPLKNYKQQDTHSCGFVAALTVSHYFNPDTSAKDVMSAVRPTKSRGIDGKGMKRAVKQLGVKATYRSDLTIGKLRKYVERRVPVLVTIWPDDWSSDHWTVVQGFDGNRVYLTNHKSLSVKDFKREWFYPGQGFVCTT